MKKFFEVFGLTRNGNRVRSFQVRTFYRYRHLINEFFMTYIADVQKTKTTFDDGVGVSGKTKTKATSKETDSTTKKDLSAVSALTEVRIKAVFAVNCSNSL